METIEIHMQACGQVVGLECKAQIGAQQLQLLFKDAASDDGIHGWVNSRQQ
ncbi:MAG: hypothetical protein LUQ02_02120 [Methanothrix sp.]|nr:hypothetical protein [Methanothrix sp.]